MKKYDPTEYQWWDYGMKKAVNLSDMNKEELIQALCSTMDTLESVESLLMKATNGLEAWRDGKLIDKSKW